MRIRFMFGTVVVALGAALALVSLGSKAAPPHVYKTGDKVADFVLKDENGKTVGLSQFKKKLIVLNFYASW